MKIKRLITVFLVATISSSAVAANLRLEVGDLHKDSQGRNGILRVWLCDNRACFDSDGKNSPYVNESRNDLPRDLTLGEEQNSAEFLFRNLPNGQYSLFIHHDRNSDGLIDNDTCLFGKPRDGLGFSNNMDPRALWRKPKWEEVRFDLAEPELALQIKPIYMCD